MTLAKTFCTVLAVLSLAVPAVAEDDGDSWYFYVKNDTSFDMTELEVSVDNETWGSFNIGSGIEAGSTVKLVWAPETEDQPCKQWIRATYDDGKTGDSHYFDFCKKLDQPIAFEREDSDE